MKVPPLPLRALRELAADCRTQKDLAFCALAMVIELESAAAVLDCEALARGDEAACGKAGYLLERAGELRRAGPVCGNRPCTLRSRPLPPAP